MTGRLIPFAWILLMISVIGCTSPDPGPEIQIQSPAEQWVNSTQGTLVFTASDNSGGTITCDIELNAMIIRTVETQSGAEIEEPLTLIPGTNEIRVKATDRVGNYAWSDVCIVHVDAEPPDVTIIDFRAGQ